MTTPKTVFAQTDFYIICLSQKHVKKHRFQNEVPAFSRIKYPDATSFLSTAIVTPTGSSCILFNNNVDTVSEKNILEESKLNVGVSTNRDSFVPLSVEYLSLT